MIFGPGDERDLAMPNLDQVPHGKHRAMTVVYLQAEQPRRPQTAARDPIDTSLRSSSACIAEAPGEDDDPVDAARNNSLMHRLRLLRANCRS